MPTKKHVVLVFYFFSILRLLLFRKKEKFKNQGELQEKIVHVNIPNFTSVFGTTTKNKYQYDSLFLQKKKIKMSCQFDKAKLCVEIGSSNATEGSAYPEIKRIRAHIESTKKEPNIKLFCTIYTYSGNSKFSDAQRETWTNKCDGVFFSSDVTNFTTGHFNLPSISRHGYKYKGMIQRLRSIYAFIYDHFLEQYDYFHFCGDDTYVIVENLKSLLSSDEVRKWEEDGNYFAGGFWAHW